jgi:hypothetical protein
MDRGPHAARLYGQGPNRKAKADEREIFNGMNGQRCS